MRKFHRLRGDRRIFVKGLIGNLILKGKIQTTLSRAKEIKPITERLTTIARRQNLSALRLLISRLPDKSAAEKLYYDLAPKYKERHGGYLRIVKSSKTRKRDGVSIATIEFV